MDKVYVIAEAGVNHNGEIDLAYKLVDEAVSAKVDAIKFQTANPELTQNKRYPIKAPYWAKMMGKDVDLVEEDKKLHLPFDLFDGLKKYCEKKNIDFISSPWDLPSIDKLVELDVDTIKIPSAEITNYPCLKKIGSLNKNVIMSVGMADLNEIRASIDVLIEFGTTKNNITILHCNSEYPTPIEDVNLKAMLTLEKEFGLKVGYSDHTMGISVPIAAVALGARVIEKHFTLDRNSHGPDHKASLEPEELKLMVKSIREIEKALGSKGKLVSPSEKKNREVMRKSIVAKTSIKTGDTLTQDNITTKRPGTGINPMNWKEVIGKKAKNDFEPDEFITI